MRILLMVIFYSSITFISQSQTNPVQDNPITPRTYYKPRAILIMLHVSSNLIESYKRKGDADGVQQVQENDAKINSTIMDDFANNFNYCPVYFYYDTEHDKVVARKLSEVHFFAFEKNKKREVVLEDTISDYYIAEISYPPITNLIELDSNQNMRNVNVDTNDEEYASHSTLGLNVYFPDFTHIKAKFGRVRALRRWSDNQLNPIFVASGFNRALVKKFDK